MKLEQLARWTEVLANIGVIVTLLLLVLEVRDNTLALQRQAIVDRTNAIAAPYLEDSAIPAILAKVKEVDGPESLELAYIDRYGLSYEEASIWSRHQLTIWNGLEADYELLGDTPQMTERVRVLLTFPDVQLWWEHAAPTLASAEFRAYVDAVRAGS